MKAIQRAETFNELGQAHVDLIKSNANSLPSKMALEQSLYNASVLTRMLEMLCDKDNK